MAVREEEVRFFWSLGKEEEREKKELRKKGTEKKEGLRHENLTQKKKEGELPGNFGILTWKANGGWRMCWKKSARKLASRKKRLAEFYTKCLRQAFLPKLKYFN